MLTDTATKSGNTTTLTRGDRKVVLSPHDGGWLVWVGFSGGMHGEDTPAAWFNGFRTCSNRYANAKTALKAAEKYLSH